MSKFNWDEILVREEFSAGDIARLIEKKWKKTHPGLELSNIMLQTLVPQIADELEKVFVSAFDQFEDELGNYISNGMEGMKISQRM